MATLKKQDMPSNMTKRRMKVKMAHTGTNSVPNGKQTPWFTIGGSGGDASKREDYPEFTSQSPWNPGKCFPRVKFGRIR